MNPHPAPLQHVGSEFRQSRRSWRFRPQGVAAFAEQFKPSTRRRSSQGRTILSPHCQWHAKQPQRRIADFDRLGGSDPTTDPLAKAEETGQIQPRHLAPEDFIQEKVEVFRVRGSIRPSPDSRKRHRSIPTDCRLGSAEARLGRHPGAANERLFAQQ
jgi:hypothetical protein